MILEFSFLRVKMHAQILLLQRVIRAYLSSVSDLAGTTM